MKIVVIGTRGIPDIQGGVETHCQELYPRLVKLGCEVILITRKPYVKSQISDYQGVRLKDIYAPKRKSLEAIVHTFLAILYAYGCKPDILHIHAIGPSLLVPFAKLLGMKVIITNHGPDYDRQKWGRSAKMILRLGERLGTKYADGIIVISKTIRGLVEKKYNRFDSNLIANGVNIPEVVATTDYIASLGLQPKNYVIGVGRFVPEKGFHDLSAAFAELGETGCKLVLVGDADHETEYSKELKRVARVKNVVLTGFIRGSALVEVFSHAKIFVMPSYHEGLPIALLEAMSYNLDVLVSDIPANSEIELPENCYFRTGDVVDLGVKLKTKLSQMHEIRDFRQTIIEKYNWNDIAEQTLRAYQRLLSNIE